MVSPCVFTLHKPHASFKTLYAIAETAVVLFFIYHDCHVTFSQHVLWTE
jgi:hypothetical protein